MVSRKIILVGVGLAAAFIILKSRQNQSDNFEPVLFKQVAETAPKITDEEQIQIDILQGNIKHAQTLIKNTIATCSGKNDRACINRRRAAGAVTLTRSQADSIHGLRGKSLRNLSERDVAIINRGRAFSQGQADIRTNNKTITEYINEQRNQIAILSL